MMKKGGRRLLDVMIWRNGRDKERNAVLYNYATGLKLKGSS